MEDTLVRLIGDVGFPIAVASFVLVRLNGKVQKLTDAMTKLAEALTKHTERSAEQFTEIDRRMEHLEHDHARRTYGGKEGC